MHARVHAHIPRVHARAHARADANARNVTSGERNTATEAGEPPRRSCNGGGEWVPFLQQSDNDMWRRMWELGTTVRCIVCICGFVLW